MASTPATTGSGISLNTSMASTAPADTYFEGVKLKLFTSPVSDADVVGLIAL